MTRKVLFLSLLSLVLSICTSVVCFANTNNTVKLGNEITSSLERGMDNVRNAADDVMDGGANLMRDGANAMDNMMDNNNYNNNNYDNNNYDNNNYYTRNTAGYNNGYNTVRTAEETNLTNNNTGMSTTTWMWIIFALAAIIIVAAIWYYAMQGNDRD